MKKSSRFNSAAKNDYPVDETSNKRFSQFENYDDFDARNSTYGKVSRKKKDSSKKGMLIDIIRSKYAD